MPQGVLFLEEQAEAILDELCRDHPLGYRPQLVWKNLRVTAGIARYLEKQIVLSRTLLLDEARMISTIKHEYAHLLAVARHGRKAAGHGPQWKLAMRDLGEEPTVRHCYEVERNSRRQEVGYRCKRCGTMIVRHRRLARGRRYYHVACGGSLKLEFVRAVAEAEP